MGVSPVSGSQSMDTRGGKSIVLSGIGKAWGDSVAVSGIDLQIPAGRFTAILGPSGCGKSTTLRIIAGLESADAGTVLIGDQDVTGAPPDKRYLSMVFQNYALFPHLTVAENIVFGLRVERMNKTQRQQRLDEVAELLELGPYLSRKPAALSGGQQQRVALGRAIVSRRPVCLMDEPLSNLDARLRDEMRREIRQLQQSLGFTMVYVTHDQTEAITMADQVVLMNNGRIEQVASPREIYRVPATLFAAQFIGTPPMNILSPAALGEEMAGLAPAYKVGFRPEALKPNANGPVAGMVHSVEFLGADTLLGVHSGGERYLARLPGNDRFSPGDTVRFALSPDNLHVFDAGTSQRADDTCMVQLAARALRAPTAVSARN